MAYGSSKLQKIWRAMERLFFAFIKLVRTVKGMGVKIDYLEELWGDSNGLHLDRGLQNKFNYQNSLNDMDKIYAFLVYIKKDI